MRAFYGILIVLTIAGVFICCLQAVFAVRVCFKDGKIRILLRVMLFKRRVFSVHIKMSKGGISAYVILLKKRIDIKKWLYARGNKMNEYGASMARFKGMLRKAKIHRIGFKGIVGIKGDAALTALVCGGVSSLLYALRAPLSPHFAKGVFVRVKMLPDYAFDRFEFNASGIASLRIGQAVYSIINGYWQTLKEAMHKWRTRSKTSHPIQWKT